jgi:hypothetical protein
MPNYRLDDIVLAFFELPTQPPMGRDPNTPEWMQQRLGSTTRSPSLKPASSAVPRSAISKPAAFRQDASGAPP